MQCDEYLLKQIDELKEQLHNQEIEHNRKYTELQNELLSIKEKSIIDKYELKNTVKEGMYEGFEKFEQKQDIKFKEITENMAVMKKEIKELQTEKFKKWQFAMKTGLTAIITTTVGWVITSLLTNFVFIHR